MIFSNKQNNSNQYISKNNKGFTIIEALIAIFILSISVASMLGVTAMSSSSSKYSNNEITANYLLQEAVDSIRNSRDTVAFQMDDEPNGGWNNFLKRYGYDVANGTKNKCFSSEGCYLEIEKFDAEGALNEDVQECSPEPEGCLFMSYNPSLESNSFYFYNTEDLNPSIFKRKVLMTIDPVNPDEVKIVATVSWKNNIGASERTQKLEVSLLNWQY